MTLREHAQTGPSAEKDRIGRFSTGMEKTGPSAEKDRHQSDR